MVFQENKALVEGVVDVVTRDRMWSYRRYASHSSKDTH